MLLDAPSYGVSYIIIVSGTDFIISRLGYLSIWLVSGIVNSCFGLKERFRVFQGLYNIVEDTDDNITRKNQVS